MSKDWEPENPLADEEEARWLADSAEQDEAEAMNSQSDNTSKDHPERTEV